MSTRHLVDPELLPLLDAPRLPLSPETLPVLREGIAALFATMAPPGPPPEVVHAPGEGGAPPVELRLHRPPEATAGPLPLVLHLHGGGMVVGTAAMTDNLNARHAAELGALVLSVDYRLAPEIPFPGPVSDAYAGLLWAAEHAGEIGADPDRIVVLGESAGGGLAAALALMTRDRGGPRLAGQALVYPMLDHRTGGPECAASPVTGEFAWTRPDNVFGWGALRGDYGAEDDRAGWFSPALAADLSGLPPTWIGVGALDLFLEEDVAYAMRLVRAGVPVELLVLPGAIHGFNFVAQAEVTRTFAQAQRRAMRRMLGTGAASGGQGG
jgi:acetyl esterase